MSKILITGFTGFTGANLIKYFESQENVTLFGHTRNSESARKQFDNRSIQIIDSITAEIINEYKIDSVIHLAGIAHDLSNQYKPEDYYKVNSENTARVYNQFLQSSATKFIFLSSIKAAVDISSSPVAENVVPSPVTDYGKSKLQAEAYIQSNTLPTGKSFYILRPCMIHGPGNKGNLNLLYKYVKSGLPYPLGAFYNQRSFLNIDNFNFIMDQLIHKQIESGIYNLADDGYLSTTELYQLLAEKMHKTARVWNIPAPLIRLPVTLMGKGYMLNKLTEDMMVSNTKLVKQLGRPLPVGIHDGLRKTIRSFNG